MATPLANPSTGLCRIAEERFQAACTRSVSEEHDVVLGNVPVRLRFANPAAADSVMPAFAHVCASASNRYGLTLAIWRDTRFLPPVDGTADVEERADYRFAHHPDCVMIERLNLGEVSLLDVQRRVGYVILPLREQLGAGPNVSPLSAMLNAWFQRRGAHVVHGAAVADERGAVLLAGRGGSGKSTTALVCLAYSRLAYLGDDLCLVDVLAPTPRVHCLYSTAKATSQEAERLRPWFDFAADGPSEKLMANLQARHGPRLVASRPLQAILLPRLGASNTRITPARAGDAFRALAPSTLGTVPCAWRYASELLAQLSRRAPAYWLDLGAERPAIPQVIADFLMSQRTVAA